MRPIVKMTILRLLGLSAMFALSVLILFSFVADDIINLSLNLMFNDQLQKEDLKNLMYQASLLYYISLVSYSFLISIFYFMYEEKIVRNITSSIIISFPALFYVYSIFIVPKIIKSKLPFTQHMSDTIMTANSVEIFGINIYVYLIAISLLTYYVIKED